MEVPQPGSNGKSLHDILVVDDDENSRDLLYGLLSRHRLLVRCAGSAREARALISDQIPDAILLDIMMPEVDGLTFLQELRSERETLQVPVLLVSALEGSDQIARGLELGANDYITKPVSTRVLMARLQTHLKLGDCIKRYEKQSRTLHRLAASDDLTGVLNRRAVMQTLDMEMARASRYGHPLSLLMVDIDGFKHINDHCGHETGDEVLRKTVGVMEMSLREADRIGRYGGDEFCVILTETDDDQAIQVAERLRLAVQNNVIHIGNKTFHVTISVGKSTLALSLEPGASHLLTEADAALYEAKRQGRNRVCCYHREKMELPGAS